MFAPGEQTGSNPRFVLENLLVKCLFFKPGDVAERLKAAVC
jgi:hypothetical protein